MPFMASYRIVLTVLLDALTFIQVGVQRITIKIILKRGEIEIYFILSWFLLFYTVFVLCILTECLPFKYATVDSRIRPDKPLL